MRSAVVQEKAVEAAGFDLQGYTAMQTTRRSDKYAGNSLRPQSQRTSSCATGAAKANELARYAAWAWVVHMVQSASAIDSTCSAIMSARPRTPGEPGLSEWPADLVLAQGTDELTKARPVRPDDARDDVPAVNPDAHVHVEAESLSALP